MMSLRTIATVIAGILGAVQAWALQPGTIAIDTQEWRDQPSRHLSIHGTLNGDTAFRVLLPDEERWSGRLLHYLEGGGGGSETNGDLAGISAYALALGAVYVESSQGHIGPKMDPEDDTAREVAYEASYAVVQYAKARCVELYRREPAFTYITGPSGGGMRSSGLIERFPRVYDGAAPVIGAGPSLLVLYTFSTRDMLEPVLRPRLAGRWDVVRPGSSRTVWDLLTSDAEGQALESLLKAGFPKGALPLLAPNPLPPGDLADGELDPDYLEEFWKTPGYGGADGEFDDQLVAGIEGTIESVTEALNVVTTDVDRPDSALCGYTMTMTSGAAAGERRIIHINLGWHWLLSASGPGARGLKAGDTFTLDNRSLLAWQALHRHIVDPTEPAMAHLVRNGRPIHPQRPAAVLDELRESDRPTGRIKGKMIAVFAASDPLFQPTAAARYHRQAREALGDAVDDHLRVHFIEHASHSLTFGDRPGDDTAVRMALAALKPPGPGQTVKAAPVDDLTPPLANRAPLGNGRGAWIKALDDLIAWVEQGQSPPPGTSYRMDPFSQVVLPASAAERKGYQPVVAITANGEAEKLEAAAGGTVTLRLRAEDPDNELALVEIDFEGDRRFDESRPVSGRTAELSFSHAYAAPGTYFPTVRVTDSSSSPAGAITVFGTPVAGIQNIASMRVVVR